MFLLYLSNAHQSSCQHDTAFGTEGTKNEQAMPDIHDCSVQASGTYPVVFCIIVSAWTCMIMEFKLVDGVQFFLVLFVLVALPPLW